MKNFPVNTMLAPLTTYALPISFLVFALASAKWFLRNRMVVYETVNLEVMENLLIS